MDTVLQVMTVCVLGGEAEGEEWQDSGAGSGRAVHQLPQGSVYKVKNLCVFEGK